VPVEGIVIGNEVIDALPFKRFTVVDHKIQEIGVSIKNGQLTESTRDADKILAEEVRLIEKALNRDFEHNYTSEIRLNIGQWLKGISSMLKSGAILFIDYGYSRHEYYAADRKNGSMICHYRNTAHENPFINLGVQDISASVEFTLLAEKALEEQLEVGLFTSQSDFLINGNILGELDKIEDDTLRMELTQEIKQLLMPSQMGQTFKCMMLYKNISLDSFEGIRDLRHTL
jgi:SAM-dependent MidA family methyltransferase